MCLNLKYVYASFEYHEIHPSLSVHPNYDVMLPAERELQGYILLRLHFIKNEV